MYRSILITVLVVFGLGCQEAAVDLESLKSELMRTDSEFSAMSVEQGMQAAFGAYMADDVVVYRSGSLPIRGRAEALPMYPDRTDIVLEWKPFLADVAASGDLGYTLGSYSLTVPSDSGAPSVSEGSYVTIWKRQSDGSWKFVFDTGQPAPSDKSTEP